MRRSLKRIALKSFAVFSLLRLQNISMIVLAQYLCAVFIFAPQRSITQVIFDSNVIFLILASAMTIAAGYLINAFYDQEKDLINKPYVTMLGRHIPQRHKITAYFVLNFSAVVVSSAISFRAVLFFSAYIFSLWVYSHKVKRIPLWGNIAWSVLTLTPFLGLFIYFRSTDAHIWLHALFLFLVFWALAMIKDLRNLPGDLSQNYATWPLVHGVSSAKYWISGLLIASWLPAAWLLRSGSVGLMGYYFMLSIATVFPALWMLWRTQVAAGYQNVYNLLKLLIAIGVFSIVLMHWTA
ncbi:MAG: hypothetical protein RL501_1083 [Bacteroidota bacterium]